MNAESRIEQFKNMAEADPTNELGHFSLGKAYFDAGRNEEAETALIRVLELNREFSKAYQLLGESRLKLDRRKDAIEILRRGYEVAARRGDVMPRDEIGSTLQSLGEALPDVGVVKEAESRGSGAESSVSGFRCTRCGRPDRQLKQPPFKGETGERIHSSICEDCWREWIGMGTKVINEMGLQLSDPRSQKVYDEYMMEFLQLE